MKKSCDEGDVLNCPRCTAVGKIARDERGRFVVEWSRDGKKWTDRGVRDEDISDPLFGCGYDP